MDREGVFGGSGMGPFDHLPLLAVRTTIDERCVERIEACNDAFVRRLGRSRTELVDEPLRSVYESETTPTPGRENHGRSTMSDGGDAREPAAPDSTRDPDGPAVTSARETEQSSAPHGADGSPAAETEGADRPRDAADWYLDEWPTHSESDPVEHSLVGADGRLIHTLVDGVARRDGSGRILLHVDVTRRRRREKQADVLNRLMRHNVRNDLNLLRGHARMLADHHDEEVAAAAAVIDRIADRWLGLAEKARQIERLFDDGPGGTVTLTHFTREVRRSVQRDWPESTLRVSIEVDPQLSISERLQPAVVELCENGIKHADCQVVSLSVTPGEADGYLDVRIADRGPGIPDHERVALLEDEETPLRHGSGLGFWIVRFVVRQLGGRISVGDDDADGGVIVLSVPLVDDETHRVCN